MTNKDTPSVLILEDNPIDGNLLSACVNGLGTSCLVLNRLELFFDAFRDKQPHLCLIDLSVGGQSVGFKVVEWVKSQKNSAAVFVISGDERLLSIRRALALGADDYILKPFDSRDLSLRLRRYVGSGVNWKGTNESLFPKLTSAVEAKLLINIGLESLREDLVCFRTSHLFKKGAVIEIQSSELNKLLSSKGPHVITVHEVTMDAVNIGYSVAGKLMHWGDNYSLYMRSIIHKFNRNKKPSNSEES